MNDFVILTSGLRSERNVYISLAHTDQLTAGYSKARLVGSVEAPPRLALILVLVASYWMVFNLKRACDLSNST